MVYIAPPSYTHQYLLFISKNYKKFLQPLFIVSRIRGCMARRKVFNQRDRDMIVTMWRYKWTVRDIAGKFEVSVSTVRRVLRGGDWNWNVKFKKQVYGRE